MEFSKQKESNAPKSEGLAHVEEILEKYNPRSFKLAEMPLSEMSFWQKQAREMFKIDEESFNCASPAHTVILAQLAKQFASSGWSGNMGSGDKIRELEIVSYDDGYVRSGNEHKLFDRQQLAGWEQHMEAGMKPSRIEGATQEDINRACEPIFERFRSKANNRPWKATIWENNKIEKIYFGLMG